MAFFKEFLQCGIYVFQGEDFGQQGLYLAAIDFGDTASSPGEKGFLIVLATLFALAAYLVRGTAKDVREHSGTA